MNDETIPIFVNGHPRLPLINDYGRAFTGLKNSSSPELVERVKSLFEYLSEHLGFLDNPEGRENQKCFNILLRSIYPEVMIDLADLIYAQHERLAVILSFEHININLEKGLGQNIGPMETNNKKMDQLFHQLARTIIESPALKQDLEIIRLLSESYSYYLYQTENFPWEYSVQPRPLISYDCPSSFSPFLILFIIIYNWPSNFPKLVLSDNDPFIVRGLSHYLELTGKKNVIIVEADFPEKPPQNIKFSSIVANKFLHHLNRSKRIRFLKWSIDTLKPSGLLEILDTDLEYHILEQSKQAGFRDKLTVGYIETLVEVEKDFTDTLKNDVEGAGFRVTHFDCRDYHDETDAFSQKPGDNLSLKFSGLEISAEKP